MVSISRLILTGGTVSLTLLLLAAVASCNLLDEWRDSQIQTSHTIAQQGGQVLPPAQPITIPDKVEGTLPVDQSFTYTSYINQNDAISITAISGWDAATTANWMNSRLSELGYDSADNPSRILEGADYGGTRKTKYASIHAKVTVNGSDQCLIEISTSPQR